MMDERNPYPMRQVYFDGGHGHHPGGLGWVIFALLLLLVLLTFAQLAFLLLRPRFAGPGPFRHLHRGPVWQGGPGWGGPDPASIARLRYARGEIARDEYLQLAGDLGDPQPAPSHEPPPPPSG